MTRHLQMIPLLALLLGSCDNGASGPVVATLPETGGSQKGDLGPPQGEPIAAVLTTAPEVPPPTGRSVPAKVVVELEVVEKVMEIAEGVDYTFWTFGGSVPGKMIRVRQGDTVEFHLQNDPANKMPHNIDLHAVTGPGGGAASSFTAPGHESVFTFKALNQGAYIYHCATAPVGMHIANGMYGMILVEPPEGFPPVDREYYVMQGDFYTIGEYGEKGLQAFDMEKAIEEDADYVLFNGKVGALTGDGALTAKVGERVRIYIGNGGPNLVSSFHVIGEIFDKVYPESGTRFTENVQTTLVPAGGSAMVEFYVEAPGTFILVDHSIFRAFNKGALGMLKVEGDEAPEIYSGKQADNEYKPAGAASGPAVPTGDVSLADSKTAGEALFATTCAACHQLTGAGLPGLFPPLAGSDFLMADEARAIGIVINGKTGPVTVNGAEYNQVMPPLAQLSDDEIAHILTYVRNSWGNDGGQVTAAEVAAVRAAGGASEAGH